MRYLPLRNIFRLFFRIFGQTVDGSMAIANFTRHVYIIEGFKPKMFIRNDILNPEIMVLGIDRNQLTTGNCKNMKIKFNVKNIGSPIKRVVRSNKVTKIPTKFNSTIFFKLRDNGLPTGRDFIFIPKKLINWETTVVFFSYCGCTYGHGTCEGS